jgi:hypothetical protein
MSRGCPVVSVALPGEAVATPQPVAIVCVRGDIELPSRRVSELAEMIPR